MKRDIDLARQLMLDIEARGADCSVSVLRTGPDNDAEERARYHLRLLTDAGYLKEIDRTSSGVPCLRLTDAGHELIELVRSEARWREAKWACQELTGGLSLVVIRSILLDWALGARRQFARRRYRPFAGSLAAPRRYAPRRIVEVAPYGDDWTDVADQVRYVRVRPKYRNGWRTDEFDVADRDWSEAPAALPEHLI